MSGNVQVVPSLQRENLRVNVKDINVKIHTVSVTVQSAAVQHGNNSSGSGCTKAWLYTAPSSEVFLLGGRGNYSVI